ncbi:MAG TPA: CAP family protein, partial [Azonexus sp.]|nr:CAP family protein [Azonexus sp.]
MLVLLMAAPSSAAAQTPGSQYLVDGRCVTITEVRNGQVSYAWRAGSASGSGSLPADMLGSRCAAARPPAGHEAPRQEPGEASPAPGAPVAASQAGDTASAGFAQEILQAHNFYRCLHGVPPLQWHAQVAEYAQAWVNRGVFEHSDSYHSPLGPMGENLYGSSRLPSGADAARAWYSESAGYAYGSDGSRGSGHFTAMIWKDARYLGCGRARGNISCNYWPGPQARGCAVPNMGG